MVNLYTALTFNACKDKLIELLKDVNAKDLNNNHIVLVPDKYSLNIEKQVLESLASKGALNIEVSTFTRFILRLKEIDIKKYIQLSDAVMIIKKLCLQYSSQFKTFSKSANLNTFAENMLLIINQFKSSGISHIMLKNSFKNLSASFSKKLFDIALLYEKYTEFLGDEYFDSSDMLNELPKILQTSDFIKSCNIYILGFDGLTKLQENCVFELFKQSKSLSLFAVKTRREDLIKINSVYQKYLKLFKGCVSETKLKENDGEIFKVLKSNLFSKGNYEPVESNNFELYEGAGHFDEAVRCAIDINYNVFSKNLRYKDFCVIFTDEKIGRTLQNVFLSYDIPCYIDNKKTLKDHPFSKLILDIINIQRLNFDKEGFLEILKNCFIEIDYGLKDRLENYILKYAVDRQKFLYPLENFLENPNEYLGIEKARQSVLNIINLMPMPKKDTGLNYCAVLKSFIKNFKAEKKLETFNKDLTENGNFYLSYSQQVLSNIEEILKSVEYIFKDTVFSLDEFYKIFASGFAAKELSLIPKVTDCVTCQDYKSIIFSNFKKMYVLGCVKNAYPKIIENTGLIKDEDIDLLDTAGLKLEPKTEDINEREKYYIYSSLLSCPEKTYLTFSGGDAAEFFDDIQKSFKTGGKPIIIKTGQDFDNNLDEEIKELYNKNRLIKYACAKILKIKNGAFDDGVVYNTLKLIKDVKTKNKLQEIYLRLIDENKTLQKINAGVFFTNNSTSISALEIYFTCPYKHFLRYGLYAKPREIAEFKPMDIGRFLHSVAEMFVNKNDFNGDINKASEEIFENIVTKDEYKKYTFDPYSKSILHKLEKELPKILSAIALQFNRSDFKPLYTEVQFGKNEKLPPVELNAGEKKIFIKGVIDRIDILDLNGEKYIRIIDYKSGLCNYSEEDLYYGKKIQLFIYLYALIKDKKYKPAGIYYFPIHNKFTAIDKSAGVYCMNGPTLENFDVIYAFDKDLKLNSGASKIINVKISGDKKLGRYSKVLNEDEFYKLCEYAKLLCENCVSEIADGSIDVFPLESSCDYCEFINVCKNFEQKFQRKTKKISISKGV